MCPGNPCNVPSGLPGWAHFDTISTPDVGVGVGVDIRVDVVLAHQLGLMLTLRLGLVEGLVNVWVRVG
jgi:hypothetical protein